MPQRPEHKQEGASPKRRAQAPQRGRTRAPNPAGPAPSSPPRPGAPAPTEGGGATAALSGVQRYRKGRSFADTLFGKIRYGLDLVTNEWVAVKEARRWFAENKVSLKGDPVRENLFNEIKIHQFLMQQTDVCPYILKQLDWVQDSTYVYVILELVQGGEFFAFIQENHEKLEFERKRNMHVGEPDKSVRDSRHHVSPWERTVRSLFAQLTESVAWMHSKGVCHRDLSLENTLLDRHRNIKVIDFGCSKLYANGKFDLNKGRIGKTFYMAPEVYGNETYDGRYADTWSLGVMLVMMLVGGPPWDRPCQVDKRFNMITNGRLRDLLVYWRKLDMVTTEAVDLLLRIFKPEKERLLVDHFLNHPFLKAAMGVGKPPETTADAQLRVQSRPEQAQPPPPPLQPRDGGERHRQAVEGVRAAKVAVPSRGGGKHPFDRAPMDRRQMPTEGEGWVRPDERRA